MKESVARWADRVCFTILPEKFKLIHVHYNHHHRPNLPIISIGEQAVKAVREIKLLRVTMDNKLTFVKHAKADKESVNA